MENITSKNIAKEWKCCVLIPTYNNGQTLADVVMKSLLYCDDVCVVNDGSTDNTLAILSQFPQIKVHSYTQNKGKGVALNEGFEFARKAGYNYAIAIDSDGQHYPDDIPKFLEQLPAHPNAIIIGARNMETTENVPTKSSFGNKFSNFWFRLETGIDLPDTQSGFRLYPIAAMKDMLFLTVKYEFEIEVMVRCAWADMEVIPIPIKVYYPPADERVSHFRPFQDFTRISILNTFLVLWTFLYIKPRNFVRLFQKKKLSEIAETYLFRTHESPIVKASSVALGAFMGIAPFWGFQMLIVIFLAWVLKLNKALAILVSNISIPPMIPIILYFSYKMGAIWIPDNHLEISFSKNLDLEDIHRNFIQYIVGSLTLATVVAIVLGSITFVWVSAKKNKSDE